MTQDEARKATADPGNVRICGMMRVAGGIATQPVGDLSAFSGSSSSSGGGGGGGSGSAGLGWSLVMVVPPD